MLGVLVNAAIPFFGGVIALLMGFRVIGKKPGEDPKFDQWHQRFGAMLKVCGVVLFFVSLLYLLTGVAQLR